VSIGEGRIAIITDSTCDLPSSMASSLDIKVIPQKIKIGSRDYIDGMEMAYEALAPMQASRNRSIRTAPPSAAEFTKLFSELTSDTREILAITISSKLSGTYAAAVTAKNMLLGRCQVEVIDSQSTSLGLGFLAESAAKAAMDGARLRDIASLIRLHIPHIHVMFCVDSLDYLHQSGRFAKMRAIAGSILNIYPLLKLEDGEIQAVERVRTRAKALERLYEFIELFPSIERVGFVHSASSEEVDALVKRTEPFVPSDRVTVARCGPALAAHIGPGALGVIVDQGTSGAI
jgi:DegV family protein with EDD domain